MSKQDAIFHVNLGWFAHHPNGAYIELRVKTVRNSTGVTELRHYAHFAGDCSPREGWQIEWLGDR